MRTFLAFLLTIGLASSQLDAQVTLLGGANLPGTCSVGQIFVVTGTAVMTICTATNTWTVMATAPSVAAVAIPTGAILLIDSGACPTGFSEVTGLNGRTPIGTLNANGNVGTTGGADTITPTVATLTAAAQVASWPAGVPTNGAIALGSFVNTATATTGNCATANLAIGTGAATACKATAPNLTVPAEGHSGTLTSPTISWPAGVPTHTTSAVTGTLNNFDNRSAFELMIFCKKT